MLRVSTSLAAPDPDQACARCHQKIFDSYKKTPMAQASGLAVDGLLPGEFTHAASGVRYRLFLRDGRAWLSYERPNASPQQALKGEQELTYFVGSGQRGRTYLFQKNGYWFESPVNWYSKQRVWDMNPKSIDAREMPFTLKVDRGCLHCHSTGVQPALGANNHFGSQPFLYGGITCQSCHGDPAAHLASGGAAPILNPAKLSPSKRDSVCLQCHLEGETVVNAPGRSLAAFVPGRESFRLRNSLRSLRRTRPQRQSDQPVGSAVAKRVQEKERRPSYLYHLPRPAQFAFRRTAGQLISEADALPAMEHQPLSPGTTPISQTVAAATCPAKKAEM